MNNIETIIDAKVNDFCLNAQHCVDNYDYACGYLNAWQTMGKIKFEKNLEYRCKISAAAGDERVVRVNVEPYNEYEKLDIPVRDICVVDSKCIWLNDTILRYKEPINVLLEKIGRYAEMKELHGKDGYKAWVNMKYVRFLSEDRILVGKWIFDGEFVE